MNTSVSDYGNIKPQNGLKSYSVPYAGKVIPFTDFIRIRSQQIQEEDEKRRNGNRERYSYLMYLDMQTEYFLGKLNELSKKEGLLFDAIVRVSVNNHEGIDLTEKHRDAHGINIEFYNGLKAALEKGTTFPGVNQTDIALLIGANQNEISRAFNSLVQKGFITQSGADKKKFFKVADIDLVGFYIMRYL